MVEAAEVDLDGRQREPEVLAEAAQGDAGATGRSGCHQAGDRRQRIVSVRASDDPTSEIRVLLVPSLRPLGSHGPQVRSCTPFRSPSRTQIQDPHKSSRSRSRPSPSPRPAAAPTTPPGLTCPVFLAGRGRGVRGEAPVPPSSTAQAGSGIWAVAGRGAGGLLKPASRDLHLETNTKRTTRPRGAIRRS